MITHRIVGDRKACFLTRNGRSGFPATPMKHLNSRVRQHGGTTHEKRACVRAPKMPIGAVYNPYFTDFTNTKETPTTETNHLLGIIRQIRQASPDADFDGKLNLGLNRRFRQIRSGGGFSGRVPFFLPANRHPTGDKRRLGPGISIGRFGGRGGDMP